MHRDRPAKARKALRVKQPPEVLMAATILAEELYMGDTERHECLAQVHEMVEDLDLAEAILCYVEIRTSHTHLKGNIERVSGIYFACLSAFMIWALYAVFHWLYGFLNATQNDVTPALFVAIAQALLVRLIWRLIKASGITITDSLNSASYPTKFHRPITTTSEQDIIRYRRLRLLIAEMVVRMEQRASFRTLFRELTWVELTKPAAFWLLVQAKLGVMIGATFPPYRNRHRAYILAGGAAFGCAVGIGSIHSSLHSQSQTYYLMMWAILLVIEFLRPPKPQPQSDIA